MPFENSINLQIITLGVLLRAPTGIVLWGESAYRGGLNEQRGED
jgi:hypothetical protein